jgi:hypothetical protein
MRWTAIHDGSFEHESLHSVAFQTVVGHSEDRETESTERNDMPRLSAPER